MAHFQASTLKLSNTKTFHSQCGMSVDKTRSDRCGDIVGVAVG